MAPQSTVAPALTVIGLATEGVRGSALATPHRSVPSFTIALPVSVAVLFADSVNRPAPVFRSPPVPVSSSLMVASSPASTDSAGVPDSVSVPFASPSATV